MKKKGSGLVEYAVPLALIALVVGIGVYNLVSSGNMLGIFLNSSNSKYDSSSKTASLNKKEAVTESVFSKDPSVSDPVIHSTGTPAKPPVTVDCTSGSCTIDYGGYVLTGVPDNLAEYVASNGTSGGSEKIAGIFEQIAKILKDNGDTAGAAQYKDLANLGHFNAKLQKTIEDIAKTSTSPTDFYDKTSSLTMSIPSNISSIVPDFNETTVYGFLESTQLGVARTRAVNSNVGDNDLTRYPGAAMYKIYNDIMSNSNYPDNLKLLTQELLLEMDTASAEMFSQMLITDDRPTSTTSPLTKVATNFIDGSTLYTEESSASTDLSLLYKPKTSYLNDVDSVLICLSGKNIDNGKSCY